MSDYMFLFDNDSTGSSEFFPKKRIVTLKQAGLDAKSSDRKIVETASDRQWIIVTSNGDDYIAEINKFLKQTKKLKCHDLSGLVILPNGYEIQKRVMPGITKKLMLDGKHISWKDVWDLDCCVRIMRDGTVNVNRFDRCFYCKKNGLK